MKAKPIGAAAVALVAITAMLAIWVWLSTERKLDQVWIVERVRIEYPWPFEDHDLVELRARYAHRAKSAPGEPPADPLTGLDLDRIRTERAVRRGEALATKLGCPACHGPDLGGAEVADPAPGRGRFAPNLTLGPGGLPGEYTLDDFDRLVRHGVKRDGTAALMDGFGALSNKDVSDLYAFMLSKPHVDRRWPSSTWDLSTRLGVALGRIELPYAFRVDHDDPGRPAR